MKKIFPILLLLILISCGMKQGLTSERFVFDNAERGKVSFRHQIPKDYSEKHLLKGGHGIEYQFWYSDSSVIYFSNDDQKATLNEENIKGKKGAESDRYIALANNQNLILKGEKNNLFWKEIILNKVGLRIGYKEVPKDKKSIFDKSLESFKIKIKNRSI